MSFKILDQFDFGPKRGLHALAGVILGLIFSVGAMAASPPSVWFMPAGNSPDVTQLFSDPTSWSSVRAMIQGFIFSPGQLDPRTKILGSLKGVDAFHLVKQWGMKEIVAVPAIKEWDCTGTNTAKVTVNLAMTAIKAGGIIDYLQLDDPLASATGVNKSPCNLTVDAAAQNLAGYIRSVRENRTLLSVNPPAKFADVEAYPALTEQMIEQWLAALSKDGFKPDAFLLDTNVHAIDRTPNGPDKFSGDLRRLADFVRHQGIPFGVIIWSGYDPVHSDKEYYDYSMRFAKMVHTAIGTPDILSFASWVKRCGSRGECRGPSFGCGKDDPSYCGSVSVPTNLPTVGQPNFTHLKLIKDVLGVFSQTP